MPWSEDDLRSYLKRRFGRPTIEQLEALLVDEEYCPIEILPNGTIREVGEGRRAGVAKPLTMRENLGGEYAASLAA